MTPHKPRVRRSFDQAVDQYDEIAVLQKEVGQRMLERLDYFKISPSWVLDLGAGTGLHSMALMKRYKSRLCAVDISFKMLQSCKARSQWLRKPYVVCGDAENLPLKDDAVDLVYSNMTLQWVQDLGLALSEIKRVSRPGACILFSTLGPDTLRELRECWQGIDDFQHVNEFLDMHNVGDALVQQGFENPVMDMEHFTLTYHDVKTLMRELKVIGAHTIMGNHRRSLMGKGKLQALINAYEAFRQEGVLPATYEVIYGHAWVPGAVPVKFSDK